MCGIVGLFYPNGKRADETVLIKMRDSMLHRGPDDTGFFIDEGIALAHRRLSIIDTSEAGRQPMSTSDKDIWIVYNGEFFNYQEHLKDISEFKLKSSSDTEAILYLYKKYGIEETIKRMNGMFAFLLYDKKDGILYVVRDRFGVKPLYIYEGSDYFAFASEYKAFFSLPDFRLELNDKRFAEYFLFGWIQGEETLLNRIKKVNPGYYYLFKQGRVDYAKTEYYNLHHVRENSNISLQEAIEGFDAIFSLSVKRRLLSDVPLGVFLSGGLDSSLILAKMKEVATGSVRSFSMGYEEEYANEFKWSDIASKKFSDEHYKMISEASELFGLYPRCTWYYDDPLHSGTGFYQVASASKPRATVMLCGQGSDEIFAGYTSGFYALRQLPINNLIGRLLGHSGRRTFSNLLSPLGKSKIFSKVGRRLRFNDDMLAASYAASIPEDHFVNFMNNTSQEDYEGLLGKWIPLYKQYEGRPFLTRYLMAEIYSELQIILQNTDKLTMGASIETRVPFLDYELVEFVFSLPNKYKINNGQGKYLLKEYAKRYFDDEFIYRQKKGFPIPLYDWYKGEDFKHFERVVKAPIPEIDKHLNLSFLNDYRDIVTAGAMGQAMDSVYPVWRIFCLKIWWNNMYGNSYLNLDKWLDEDMNKYLPV